MEHHSGSDARSSLRLVNAGGETVWEPDPAVDAEELDALAELFIGEEPPADTASGGDDASGDLAGPEEDGTGGEPERQLAVIEAVITGHLPVRGAVWVRAYAASVARSENRPVALVRVTGNRTTVELIGSAVATEPVTDIALAIDAVSSATGHWLLHFDEIDQAGMLREETIDRVTVLSGADEPAVVSAYRLLKSVSDDRGEEAALDVGVAIVGSGRDETVRATDRLGVAARRFLSLELSGRTAVPRVEAATVSLIGDLPQRCDPSGLLGSITACTALEADRAPQPTEPDYAEPDSAEPDDAGPTRGSRAREDTRTPGTPARGTPQRPAAPGLGTVSGTGREPAAEPRAAAQIAEPKPMGDRPRCTDLIPGLTVLDVPCPVAPGIELAADAEGMLHLLSWWSEDAPARLLRAKVWAGVNLLLIARLGPINPEIRHPSVHVVCDALAQAVDLRGGGIRVHLARPATPVVDGWLAAPVE